MRTHSLWARVAVGAVSGFLGTLALTAIRNANQKWMPEGAPPMKQDPAEFMVRKARQALPDRLARRVPEQVESSAVKLLPLAYGMTFGALYSGIRSESSHALREGIFLGLLTWAVGYLGWLPRTHLMPPISKQAPKQVVLPIVEHAVYGVATVEGFQAIKRLARS